MTNEKRADMEASHDIISSFFLGHAMYMGGF